MLLAFSYTWSVVPRKNYLMPESSHVLVEKFFQFEHICFFFPQVSGWLCQNGSSVNHPGHGIRTFSPPKLSH